MDKDNLSKKIVENSPENSIETDEELAFIEYQENVARSKEARRNRLWLIALSFAVYLLGLGIFATIVQTLLQISKILGIVVASILFIIYTICFIVVIVQIYSKQSFDIEMKKKENYKFSERKNNNVRWSIAKNIKEQSVVLDYLQKEKDKEYLSKNEAEKVEAFETIISLASAYNSSVPSYKSEVSATLSTNLSIAMRKDGVIYKKAKSLIMKRAISTGCLTALSQNAVVDMSIVAVKNMQLIKDLIWLYGFRPTNYEMNKIMMKVLKNVCISIGLNTMPKHVNFISKVFNKDSNNFFIQLFGHVLDMGAQFLGNGTMTYLIGRYTINVLLNQYHLQEILRQKTLEEYELEVSSQAIETVNAEIEDEIKQIKVSKKEDNKVEKEDTDAPLLIEDSKPKFHFFRNIFHHKNRNNDKKKDEDK